MTTLSYCLAASAETPLTFAVTASGLVVVESFWDLEVEAPRPPFFAAVPSFFSLAFVSRFLCTWGGFEFAALAPLAASGGPCYDAADSFLEPAFLVD